MDFAFTSPRQASGPVAVLPVADIGYDPGGCDGPTETVRPVCRPRLVHRDEAGAGDGPGVGPLRPGQLGGFPAFRPRGLGAAVGSGRKGWAAGRAAPKAAPGHR